MIFSKFQDIASPFRAEKFPIRLFFLGLSIIISVAVYSYIVNVYNPEYSIWTLFSSEEKAFDFYSGGNGGVYHAIGKSLQEHTVDNDEIHIKNIMTSGGADNAVKVLTNKRAFGLIQEESVKRGDFIREELHFVAPLYIERMHIIYRKDAWIEKEINEPTFSSNSNIPTLKFFASSNISIGPIGSGTRILSSYFIDEINKQIFDTEEITSFDQQILNVSMAEGFEKIKSKELDVMFVIAGAPLKSVQTLLDNSDEYGLISVDPGLVTKLNRENSINLRITDFKNVYRDQSVSTFGSYCFLIASKDVRNDMILNLLENLDDDDVKSKIKSRLDPPSEVNSWQMEEYDFLKAYRIKFEHYRMRIFKNILIFIVTVFSLSGILLTVALKFISLLKQIKYFKKVQKIIQDHLPKNFELNENEGLIPSVKIASNQFSVITKIILGTQQLFIINDTLNSDYRTGGITDNHYEFLVEIISQTKAKLRRSLSLRLNELIEQNKYPNELSAEIIRQYYTGDYLMSEDYLYLSEKIRKNGSH